MEARRSWLTLLVAMSIPVLLALTIFPTVMIDTRELMIWGREFPLGNFKHPPLMVWLGGLVDMVFGSHAAWSVLWSQVLDAIGVYYTWLILRRITSPQIANLMAVLLGSSVTFAMYSMVYSLNADMIQLPLWPAVFYHLIRGIETNQWRHWLLLGVVTGLAILAKYTGFLFLAALAVGVLLDARARAVVGRPGAYFALAVAAIIVAPHALWLLDHLDAFNHSTGRISGRGSLLDVAESYAILFGGTLFLLMPGLIILAVGLWRKEFRWQGIVAAARKPDTDTAWISRLALVTLIVCALILMVLIPVTGLIYFIRYSSPFLFLLMIILAAAIQIVPATAEAADKRITRALIAIWLGVGLGTAVLYSVITVHDYMQEPVAKAATTLRKEWRSNYACDPAMIIGDRRSAHAIALDFSPDIEGMAQEDVDLLYWYDADKIRRNGAILIAKAGGADVAKFKDFLPELQRTQPQNLELPFRRNFTGKTYAYTYVFLPPTNCSQ